MAQNAQMNSNLLLDDEKLEQEIQSPSNMEEGVIAKDLGIDLEELQSQQTEEGVN